MCIWCNSTLLFWEKITCHGFQSTRGGQSYVGNWKGYSPKSQEALVLIPDLGTNLLCDFVTCQHSVDIPKAQFPCL